MIFFIGTEPMGVDELNSVRIWLARADGDDFRGVVVSTSAVEPACFIRRERV
jgi:hypothetical protein